MKLNLIIWSYLLENIMDGEKLIMLERTSIDPHPEKWAIRYCGLCLSKQKKKFCYETLPSLRDEPHYKEFRFDSEQEAITFWMGNRGEIIV